MNLPHRIDDGSAFMGDKAEVGHRVTSLGHLGQIAIYLGQKLEWDPDNERFLDNDAANTMIDKPILAPPQHS